MPNILPTSSIVYTSVPVHGVTKLGIRSYPTMWSAPEAITITFSYSRSDKPVYTTAFSHLLNPYQTFLGRDLYRRLWGIPRFWGAWSHSDCKFHISGLELKAVILALHYWVTVLRGHQVMIATDNTTVVYYINKQGGTHFHTLLRLVVDLFRWLQTQDIASRARHIPGYLNVIADYLDQISQ